MLKPVTAPGGQLTFETSVRGIAIYLDTFALKSLARGDPSLRQRFVAVVTGGADLLFSVTNAVEICGSTGASSSALKNFLNELGPNWYPIEMSLDEVMAREQQGLSPGACCIDEDLLRAFFSNRTCKHTPGSGRVIDLSESFFQLGAFVDWLAPQRNYFLGQRTIFDDMLQEKIPLLRAKHKQNPGWLDRAMPEPLFHPSRAATFAHWCLMRDLICDSGYQVKKGDAMDFHHAVMACAFANFAALDKHWKRRIVNLPKPNRTPRIYYEPELAAMVADIESALLQLRNRAGM
jgi:hypothetical protein